MRIKKLFTVPEGEKVTEKMFTKVLISSVCSILLCMACLVSTTWAWFTVSVENTGNVIQIASATANVSISDGVTSTAAESVDNSYELSAGTYTIEVTVNNDATDWKQPVYVLMSVLNGEKTDYYYLTFAPENTTQRFNFSCGNQVTVSFSVSWIAPVSATPIGNEAVVADEIPTEPETEPSTQPTSATTEESTAATDPTEESTVATDCDTTTCPSSEPTESATQAVEESAIPATEATTAPTTEVTVSSTEVTEPTAETEATTVPSTTE